jgi:hypothetical protein
MGGKEKIRGQHYCAQKLRLEVAVFYYPSSSSYYYYYYYYYYRCRGSGDLSPVCRGGGPVSPTRLSSGICVGQVALTQLFLRVLRFPQSV